MYENRVSTIMSCSKCCAENCRNVSTGPWKYEYWSCKILEKSWKVAKDWEAWMVTIAFLLSPVSPRCSTELHYHITQWDQLTLWEHRYRASVYAQGCDEIQIWQRSNFKCFQQIWNSSNVLGTLLSNANSWKNPCSTTDFLYTARSRLLPENTENFSLKLTYLSLLNYSCCIYNIIFAQWCVTLY